MNNLDKARVGEARKGMINEIAYFYGDVNRAGNIADNILSLKDKDGKPMLAVLSRDQSKPKVAQISGGDVTHLVEEELHDFRRVIIMEENSNGTDRMD